MTAMLHITPREIRRAGRGNVLAVCWRQWRAERSLERRGLHFRSTDSKTMAAAYSAMTEAEFDAVNGRQDWANWRTIPRALNGHVPMRPLRILDLGCGTGGSTRVLAWYCASWVDHHRLRIGRTFVAICPPAQLSQSAGRNRSGGFRLPSCERDLTPSRRLPNSAAQNRCRQRQRRGGPSFES